MCLTIDLIQHQPNALGTKAPEEWTAPQELLFQSGGRKGETSHGSSTKLQANGVSSSGRKQQHQNQGESLPPPAREGENDYQGTTSKKHP